jgi:hypothetical protein
MQHTIRPDRSRTTLDARPATSPTASQGATRSVALITLLVIAACGLTATVGRASAGTSPGAVVYSATYRGGFTIPGTDFRTVPAQLIDTNRNLYSPGAITMIYPGPALFPIIKTPVSKSRMQAFDRLAREAGLQRSRLDWGTPNTADVPDLVLTYRGKTHTIPSFGVGEESLTKAQQTNRQRVRKLMDSIGSLASPSGSLYTPTSLVIAPRLAVPEDTPPDLTVQRLDWPDSIGTLDNTPSCAVLSGPNAAAALRVLQQANDLTQFRSNGKFYRVLVRPALPGDLGCQ